MRWALVFLAACAHDIKPPLGGDVDAGPAVWQAPLGAHWNPEGTAVEFRLAAPHATHVELELFDPAVSIAMTRTGDVWAATAPSASTYGYRVWGPNWVYDPSWTPGSTIGWITDVDHDGNRMNPNKLVVDPYAEELTHDPVGTGAREVDDAQAAPRGIVLHASAAAAPGPSRPLADDIVYEVHVRGFTQALAIPCAGTFAGASTRADYLAALGVTAVEFLPVQETSNDHNDADPTSDSGDNYWGYSTLAYFAPDRRYACDHSDGGPTREFRAMVDAFHARGIKVLIDVVYNHTAEGSGNSLLSMRGIDNAAYYQLDKAGTGFTNDNGVGADLAADKPLARALILDSLAYWHATLGVDGYRFDLAPVLGNSCGAGCFTFSPDFPSTIAGRARPATGGAGVDLIAEPWAVVAGGYQLGKFPAGWASWNDRIRDSLRIDQNESPVSLDELRERVLGSPATFATPAGSINYLVSHDGFTLHDLYACAAPSNAQPWPFGPSDGGSTSNHSAAQGEVAQRQAARTGLALLALSQGVPMITGGDELGRTLHCNNNSYNLDSPATWIDWASADAALTTYTSRLFTFRAAHPSVRESASVSTTNGVLAWRSGDVYAVYNHAATQVTITLPDGTWVRSADTSSGLEPDNFAAPGSEYVMHQSQYGLAGHALAVFLAR